LQPLIFDLDGTLIDSAPDIHAAANKLMASIGRPGFELAEVKSFIGNGVPVLVERVMTARDLPTDQHSDLVASFLAYYEADSSTLTRPYPGAISALHALLAEGYRLGICTNKPEKPTRRILSDLGMSRFFGAIVGGDTLSVRKPNPEPLAQTINLLGSDSCIYIGDSEIDADTAKNLGVPFVLFTEGYRKSKLEDLEFDVSFGDFIALPQIISAMTGAD
jgi:phosphoglycolate phosphatase